MKIHNRLIFRVLTLLAASLFASVCLAAGTGNSTFQTPVDYQSTKLERVGVGLATLSNIGGSPVALSIWADLNADQSLQGVLAVGGSHPFQFGVGGFYRSTVVGTRFEGFHIGAGGHMGQYAAAKTNHLYVHLAPLAGFHFGIPNLSNLMISFDAGMNFDIYDGELDFSLKGASPAMGLAIHYFL